VTGRRRGTSASAALTVLRLANEGFLHRGAGSTAIGAEVDPDEVPSGGSPPTSSTRSPPLRPRHGTRDAAGRAGEALAYARLNGARFERDVYERLAPHALAIARPILEQARPAG
jgi:hypothetical protein